MYTGYCLYFICQLRCYKVSVLFLIIPTINKIYVVSLCRSKRQTTNSPISALIMSLWYSPDNGSWSQATILILMIIRACSVYFVSPTTGPNGTIMFVDQNIRPSTTTLPLTQSKPESITSADILFTLVIDDVSYPGQTHTVKIDCTPAEWENLFELDGGSVLEYRIWAAARQTQQNDAKTQISLGIRPVWSVFTMRSVGS